MAVAGGRAVYPEVIPLHNGFQPEGITTGNGHTFYTGSLNGGAIFMGDYRTGEVVQIAPPRPDRTALGKDFDPRSNLLFVAGGAFGAGYIYDGSTGADVATYQLTAPFSGFINDVIVTREAAYFTDSFQPQMYKLPLGAGGEIPDNSQVETIPLGGDFVFLPGNFNANGIEASANGKWLIIINTGAATLYRVHPDTGMATQINLGGAGVANGDGLVLRGSTLFVVQNVLNQISVFELNDNLTAGNLINTLTSPHFRIPTTAALFGDALYVVNARFNEIPPTGPTPDDEFEAVRVSIH
jgi:sugar lactone lactonase YvrE